MNPGVQALDALTCPLDGVNLIEASAGTGKTWTIAALYTRLLLEGEAPPPVERILVVTYTRAATAELRSRLRRRLDEMLAVLDGAASSDSFLTGLAARFAGEAERALARRRLTAALTGFDAAAIYTIHGFCQRVLTDAAFESGQTFSPELVDNDAQRLARAASDFWRRRVQNDALLAELVAGRGETPQDWLGEVRPFLSRPYLHVRRPDPADLARARARVDSAWQALCRDRAGIDAAIGMLLGAEGLKATSYGDSRRRAMAEALRQRVDGAAGLPPPGEKERKLLEKLTPASLSAGAKKNATPPEHAVFAAVESWLEATAAYREAAASGLAGLKLDLIASIDRQLVDERRSERGRSFDDLLTGLADALADPTGGAALARHVASSFQVALIDEFQDTDPIQYPIFRRCFVEQQRPVFLVGDPKQAIYSFRGADIFAYLAARADADRGRVYSLDTNRRSVDALVAAVNALFARPQPFVLPDIDYHPVRAAPSSGCRLEVDDDRAPFTVQWLDGAGGGERGANKQLASECAVTACGDEIARLLTLAAAGGARLVRDDGGARALDGGDIAVLVATHRQGEQVRAALRERGINSVALTQESVFASREAQELLALLRAWAEPGNEGRLRRVLAGVGSGLDAPGLKALCDDESAWEARLALNADDHARWSAQGFMAAWRGYMARERLAERLLPLEDGERRLTNFSHLAELLQSESERGAMPLLAWFESQVAAPPAGEDAVLRLESDAALVKIVTVHSAKGLQYPVVFCPFLWDGALERKGSAFWRYRSGETPWLVPDALADAEVRAAARSEILAEKMRLLYVALTRAQYRQYLCWGWVQKMETAALSWLVHGEGIGALSALEAQEMDATRVENDMRRFVERLPGAAALQSPPPGFVSFTPPPAPPRQFAARTLGRPLYTPWRFASFTSLAHGGGGERPDHDRGATVSDEGGVPLDRFHFPRGARAGTCLHAIFERIDFAADDATIRGEVERQLALHGIAPEWTDAACDMIRRALSVPLDPDVRLDRVAAGRRLVELEFLLPVTRLDVAALIRVLSDPGNGLAEPLRAAAARLDFHTVRGFIKGFMDLVFELDGKVYLVDYKSNHLGYAADDYSVENLAQSVAREHYYLQYLIYRLALLRYFATRGSSLRFGGVRYLYLRGLDGDGNGVWRDEPGASLLAGLESVFFAAPS
ncbi:exodeoxyribonuclease V subunit beta [Paludibacterium yongneupense]|uniref:exodeoxyribonuclease V subunit beta n=1 Tax=Paludibacterium yongneupense TaxID=400061 RepID=UPI00040E5F75|nr:exodeoxyribonuclease V subunit beta [Paludibacterium yongneupense]